MDDLVVYRLIVVALALTASGGAAAHQPLASAAAPALEFSLGFVFLGTGILYGRGIVRLWRKAGVGGGVRPREAGCFTLGWLALVVALLSRLDAVAQHSFAVHMVQHELLMVVAAPLIVLGRPLEAFAWGLPREVHRPLAVAARSAVLRRTWQALTTPLGAWSIHAVALWTWHLPLLFALAMTHLGWHFAQHGCFFASALGFWWSVFGGRARTATAMSIASLFTTMLHTSALGALLTFAPSVWYPLDGPPAFGLAALEDQQLGGLVMWVPGGLAYVIAALALMRRWLAQESPILGSQVAPRSGASPIAWSGASSRSGSR